ncbi:MAG TPA: hypothetical protein VJ991_01675 [Balneolales bacterium]|nr:hypothetical protein [Balneolales bacterium]
MTTYTKELKSLLHESIENIDDEAFLMAIKNILDHKYEPQEKIVLTPEQEKRIEQAKESIQQGNYLTNDQADKLVTKWLNE